MQELLTGMWGRKYYREKTAAARARLCSLCTPRQFIFFDMPLSDAHRRQYAFIRYAFIQCALIQ
jgi:hypothetical protein